LCPVEGTRVSVYPSPQTVIASSNVTFYCIVTTDPDETSSLQIYWRRDGKWLVMTDLCTHRCLITTFEGRNSSLFITGVTTADTGQYMCRAISSVDTADATASLLVKGNNYNNNKPLTTRLSTCLFGCTWCSTRLSTCLFGCTWCSIVTVTSFVKIKIVQDFIVVEYLTNSYHVKPFRQPST